jgi:TldD protein
MTITRRDLLKTGASAAALLAVAAVPRPLHAHLGGRRIEPVPPVDDPRLRELALRGVDAARAAGALYADVRLTHTWRRFLTFQGGTDIESITVGVRALVNGYWGFASGPVWSLDEMARLGNEAVHQAKANTLGKPRIVDLAPVPAVIDKHWVMPVKTDPFDISIFEINDRLLSLAMFVQYSASKDTMIIDNGCELLKQEKAFASSVGSYCTQRTYRTKGTFQFSTQGIVDSLECLSPAGVGWEMYRDQPLEEIITQHIEVLRKDAKLPIKPVEVGRYDTVFDNQSVATLLHETLGPATELDRALGYEANAGGTSYINDPFEMLGSYQAGAPNLTVTANRSEAGGCATVQWDDEGVTPEEFTMLKDGVLADFQTTRESAGWLKDYYAKTHRPFRSHGCAAAPAAVFAPLQHAPNLVMAPGSKAQDFDALIAGLTKGIAVRGVTLDMDFQHSSGLGTGLAFEVKNGKRVARLNEAGLLFRASDLWKGLLEIGGKESSRRFGMMAMKGEPEQEHYSSVTAPTAVFKQVTLIDALRKA